MYCNCLVTRLWRHEFRNNPILSYLILTYPYQAFKVGEHYKQVYYKLHSIKGIFQIILPQVKKSDIEKCIFMAGSELVLEIFLNGCFSSPIAVIYLLILMVPALTHTLHF